MKKKKNDQEKIAILKEKVKTLIELKPGKQYLMVFSTDSGLTVEDLVELNRIIDKNFNVKIFTLLLRDINSMRILEIEK